MDLVHEEHDCTMSLGQLAVLKDRVSYFNKGAGY